MSNGAWRSPAPGDASGQHVAMNLELVSAYMRSSDRGTRAAARERMDEMLDDTGDRAD